MIHSYHGTIDLVSERMMHTEVELEAEDWKDLRHFNEVVYKGNPWDLSHLKPYSFTTPIVDYELPIRVVVLFACHCFTREATDEEIATGSVAAEDWYVDEVESRVLDEERYLLSRKHLPAMVKALSSRKITVADENRRNGNFVTLEIADDNGIMGHYSVFFEFERERKRKIKLRVQSAYVRQRLTKRELDAKPVKLNTILKATLEGRKIHG